MTHQPFRPNAATHAKLEEMVMRVGQAVGEIMKENGDDAYKQVAMGNLLVNLGLAVLMNHGIAPSGLKTAVDDMITGLVESARTGVPFCPKILVPEGMQRETEELSRDVS